MAYATKTRSSQRGARSRANAPKIGSSGWRIRRTGGLHIVESAALARLPWLVHGFSTRPGGESVAGDERVLNLGFTDWDERQRVDANRLKFMAAIDRTEDMRLVTLRQIHSDVIRLGAPASARVLKGDALATQEMGVLLSVQTADCVPILLTDVRQRAVAAIHAGWRGTVSRIVTKTLGRMRMEFGTRARDVVAALGPAIGGGCYEVGADVAQAFASQFPTVADWFDGPFAQLAHGEEPLWLPWLTMMPPGHVPPPPRVQLDLRASNRWQLVDAGVPEAQIHVSDLCTACRADLLFSYRREHEKAGRMMAVIGLRS